MNQQTSEQRASLEPTELRVAPDLSDQARLVDLVGLGDPLADQAMAEFREAPSSVQALLLCGMQRGVAAIAQAPASFQAFLQDAEDALSEQSPALLVQAADTYLLITPIWGSIALGPGSLVHTYADEAIAAVLMRTGTLSGDTAARRLLETSLWNLRTIRPGGLVVGGPGYIQTLQVRLLHARVRAALHRGGWSAAAGSSPIDQRQMLRTWLDFTAVALRCLGRVGFAFHADELGPVYALWRVVGRLLGIPPAALDRVDGPDAAQAVLAVMDHEATPPGDNARVLTGTMLAAIGSRLALGFRVPEEIGHLMAQAFCRLFHGDEMADQLGVPENWTASLLPVFAEANRGRLTRARQDPEYRRALMQETTKIREAIEASVNGATAYEAGFESVLP